MNSEGIKEVLWVIPFVVFGLGAFLLGNWSETPSPRNARLAKGSKMAGLAWFLFVAYRMLTSYSR